MHTSPNLLRRSLPAPTANVRAALALAALLVLALALAPRAGASVYWGNAIGPTRLAGTTIGRANNDGTGVNQNFIGGASTPEAVTVDGAHVYWVNETDGFSIGRANLDGTGVNPRFITGVNAGSLAVDAAHIYWTDASLSASGNRIGRANLDGTGIEPDFIAVAGHPAAVAVDRAHVYWTNIDTEAIGRANLDGTGIDQSFIALGLTRHPLGIAVDAAHLYWVDGTGSIGRASIDGSGLDLNFVPTGPAPHDVAVDSAHIYWTQQFPSPDGLSGGKIGRANLDGTGVNQTFLSGNAIPQGVATDVTTQAAPRSHISIGDVTTAEGDAGQTAFRFQVSLDQAQPAQVTVDYATADDTATAPGDYAAGAGTLTFAPGETAKTVTVQVNGDTTVEPDEAFDLNLANPTGNASIVDAQAVGTIVNDDQPVITPRSQISIGDVRTAEGNTGQTAFRFDVSLDQAQSAPVTVDYTAADGTATAPDDYAASTGTVTFAPGETAKTVTVQVNGDTTVEPDETFRVDLANATGNATIADASGAGTIVNDDQPAVTPRSQISIGDVRTAEGNIGQTAFRFDVSLDQAQSAPVTVDYATADGTATAPDDYAASTGTVTFAPGETAKAVTVQVNGDKRREPDETFGVNLSNAAGNATIADGNAIGTIVNDDRRHARHWFMLGKVRLDPETGTARLAATVPGPGVLAISGAGVKAARAVIARSARAARTLQLRIAASGSKQRTLHRIGEVTVKPRVTYTPAGGRPRTRTRHVRLQKR